MRKFSIISKFERNKYFIKNIVKFKKCSKNNTFCYSNKYNVKNISDIIILFEYDENIEKIFIKTTPLYPVIYNNSLIITPIMMNQICDIDSNTTKDLLTDMLLDNFGLLLYNICNSDDETKRLLKDNYKSLICDNDYNVKKYNYKCNVGIKFVNDIARWTNYVDKKCMTGVQKKQNYY